jgi:hypothetical protein
MKAITIGDDLNPISEPCEYLSKFGMAHGIANSFGPSIGVGFPFVSVGYSWEILGG